MNRTQLFSGPAATLNDFISATRGPIWTLFGPLERKFHGLPRIT